MPAVAQRMTTAELLAMPDDGIERWLIDGELREGTMSYRNKTHSRVMTRAAQHLAIWNDNQPAPRGMVLTGDAGFILHEDPDTTVGADVAYVSAALLAAQTDENTVIQGPPTLAVEILSPNDRHKEVHEKVQKYLAAGAAHVWVVNPDAQYVMVHRPGEKPQLVNVDQELTAEPDMPGLRLPVAALFE